MTTKPTTKPTTRTTTRPRREPQSRAAPSRLADTTLLRLHRETLFALDYHAIVLEQVVAELKKRQLSLDVDTTWR